MDLSTEHAKSFCRMFISQNSLAAEILIIINKVHKNTFQPTLPLRSDVCLC